MALLNVCFYSFDWQLIVRNCMAVSPSPDQLISHITLVATVNFKVYCRPHSESLSSLAPNSSNYREAIRAFPNHTAGFPTRVIAL